MSSGKWYVRNVPNKLRVARVACPHDCPDACLMRVTVDTESGRAIKVEGDPTHPVTRGYLCNKVNHYLDLVYNDQRVLYPHRRIGPKGPGAKFQRITWDEALTEIAARLKAVIAEYVAPKPSNLFPTRARSGMLGFLGMGERFFNKMGAARLERTICTAAGAAAEMHTFGRVGDANIEDLPHMDVVILWGTNLVSTGVHAMPFVNAGARQRRENHRHRSARNAHHRVCRLAYTAPARHRCGAGAGHDENHRRSRPARPGLPAPPHRRLGKTARGAPARVSARAGRSDHRA